MQRKCATVLVTRDDAGEAMQFTEALIDYLYVFRRRYEDFQLRRADGKQEPADP